MPQGAGHAGADRRFVGGYQAYERTEAGEDLARQNVMQ